MTINERMLTPVHNEHTNPVLEFRDGQALLRMVNDNGCVHERLISWNAVREACAGLPVDSGWLAPEVCRWGSGANGDWAIAFIPPSAHDIEVTVERASAPEEVERINTPLPGMIIFGIGVKYFVWAVKTEKLEPHHEVYRAPLPNVMADASVCWGLHKPPRASARTLLEAWRLFMTSTFNNHAAPGKSKRNKEDVREVLKELARAGDVARYPVDDLVRQVEGTGVTLDKAIKRFFETQVMPS